MLADGSWVVEEGDGAIEPAELAAALGVQPPFRAEAIRRTGSTWAVGAKAIAVVELPLVFSSDELEVVWDGTERTVQIDGEPSFSSVPELEQLASSRYDTWVARARRIRDETWEVEIGPL